MQNIPRRNFLKQLACPDFFDSDPLFVPGPLGDFYLENTGENVSYCINHGSANADTICFVPIYTHCLDEYTTQGETQDTDVEKVDVGYHYPICVNHGDVDFSSIVTAADCNASVQGTRKRSFRPRWE